MCKAEFLPATVDFGAISVGFPETKNVRLINTGTGACTVTAYHIADCTSDGMGTICPSQLEGSASKYFEFSVPPPTKEGALDLASRLRST